MKDRLYAAIHASLEMLANLRRQDLEAKPGVVLCSDCLYDRGLKDGAMRHGTVSDDACPNCGSIAGHKLDRLALNSLVYEFFAVGTIHRCEYGAAPQLAFNEVQTTSINFPQWLASDLKLIEKSLGIGFFYYGPRLWMIGEVEPLKALQDEATRNSIVTRILSEYPKAKISAKETFYRLRKDPSKLADFGEYDSAPTARAGAGRLDSSGFPVMYGSQDLQICVHECRVTAEDNMFVATLAAKRDLKLLDLTALIPEEETEFESLDMAIHMLFLAGKYSYPISRDIALAAHKAGFDGLVYPSYFSLLRTGGLPFETMVGMSLRRLSRFADYERAKIIPNLAIFGRPIEDGLVSVQCINRLIMRRVEYDLNFGPTGVEPSPDDDLEIERSVDVST